MVGLVKWKSHVIDRKFSHHRARIIKRITLNERAPPNLMICSNSKDERYTGTRTTPIRYLPKKEQATKTRKFNHKAGFIVFYHEEIKSIAYAKLCPTINARTPYQQTIIIQILS